MVSSIKTNFTRKWFHVHYRTVFIFTVSVTSNYFCFDVTSSSWMRFMLQLSFRTISTNTRLCISPSFRQLKLLFITVIIIMLVALLYIYHHVIAPYFSLSFHLLVHRSSEDEKMTPLNVMFCYCIVLFNVLDLCCLTCLMYVQTTSRYGMLLSSSRNTLLFL